jgi:hypothetical protein
MSYPVPRRDLDGFVRECEEALRRPVLSWDGTATVADFYPDLSPAEQDTYTALLRLQRSRLGLTPAEFGALAPDISGLRTYHGLASPTAAQTAAATKALIRVLRAILD